MFGRNAFILSVIAMLGIVCTICAVIASTPFFPKSLQTEPGECPANIYFPAQRREVLSQFESDWFSSEILPFGEKPIFQDKQSDAQTVRFTLMRSFNANAMVRTVDLGNGSVRLVGKLMPGRDGCKKQRSMCTVDRFLTKPELKRLKQAQSRLLQTPSYGCGSGVDDSIWLIEASGRETYRVWQDWSPQQGDLRNLALVMLDLAGWRFEETHY